VWLPSILLQTARPSFDRSRVVFLLRWSARILTALLLCFQVMRFQAPQLFPRTYPPIVTLVIEVAIRTAAVLVWLLFRHYAARAGYRWLAALTWLPIVGSIPQYASLIAQYQQHYAMAATFNSAQYRMMASLIAQLLTLPYLIVFVKSLLRIRHGARPPADPSR